MKRADPILFNGEVHTVDTANPLASAAAIADGNIIAVGDDNAIIQFAGENTKLINLEKKTLIPEINVSHLHPIRGGLNYNLELRWDGVPSIADALRMLKEQVDRTPSPQWVWVVSGWTEFQFAERRGCGTRRDKRHCTGYAGIHSAPV
jgi:predicted amidohydrolase YtcJ